jgi:hypothetical protein
MTKVKYNLSRLKFKIIIKLVKYENNINMQGSSVFSKEILKRQLIGKK